MQFFSMLSSLVMVPLASVAYRASSLTYITRDLGSHAIHAFQRFVLKTRIGQPSRKESRYEDEHYTDITIVVLLL